MLQYRRLTCQLGTLSRPFSSSAGQSWSEVLGYAKVDKNDPKYKRLPGHVILDKKEWDPRRPEIIASNKLGNMVNVEDAIDPDRGRLVPFWENVVHFLCIVAVICCAASKWESYQYYKEVRRKPALKMLQDFAFMVCLALRALNISGHMLHCVCGMRVCQLISKPVS